MKTCPTCNKEFKNLGAHLKKHAKDDVNAKTIEDIKLTQEVLDAPLPTEPAVNTNNCEYYLKLQFNNETLDCYTNNLKISFLSLARPVMTEAFITIKKGDAEFLKKVTLVKIRQLFNDNQALDIFLNTYYSLYGRPSKV